MEKIKVLRPINVLVKETYLVENIDQETLEAVINYEIEVEDSEVLWDTMEEIGNCQIWNEDFSKQYYQNGV